MTRVRRTKKQKLFHRLHLGLVLLLWLSLIAIIFLLPPKSAWRIGLFFGLLVLSLLSSLFLVSQKIIINFLVVFLVSSLLFLEYLNLLTWLNGSLLFATCLFLFFFLAKLRKSPLDRN